MSRKPKCKSPILVYVWFRKKEKRKKNASMNRINVDGYVIGGGVGVCWSACTSPFIFYTHV